MKIMKDALILMHLKTVCLITRVKKLAFLRTVLERKGEK